MNDSPLPTQAQLAAPAGAKRLNPKLQLVWREMDDEWAVFEPLSGQTHQMEAVAATALTCLESGQFFTAQSLLVQMQADFGLDLGVQGILLAQALLDQFEALGLTIAAAAPQPVHAVV